MRYIKFNKQITRLEYHIERAQHFQLRSILINQSIFLKKQESQKKIQKLEKELSQSKKEIQNVKKQMIQKQTQNEIKSNKLKTDNDFLKKRLIGVQKIQVENDSRYKQLFKDHTQLLIQMNSLLVRNTELQKQQQEQKILNTTYEKQKNREQQIANKVEHRQTMSADYGVNTPSIDQHNEVKEIIQKSEMICKMQEQHRKTKQYLQQKIVFLQNQKCENKKKIEELISKNKLNENIKGMNIKQLTENLQQIQKTLAQKNKQIDQLHSQIARNQSEIDQKSQQINKLRLQMQKKEEQLQHQIKISNSIAKPNQRSQQRFIDHLFTSGDIFEEQWTRERNFLIKKIQQRRGQLTKTKLIYKYDINNKVNIHKYIDGHKQIVVVIRTEYGKLIAGYSQQAFSPNGIVKGDGLLLSLWNQRTFNLIKGKKAITYDDFYLIFGNSQIRIKSLQLLVFSNFGINNAFYQTQGIKIQQWLGDNDREVAIDSYEVYELQFAY